MSRCFSINSNVNTSEMDAMGNLMPSWLAVFASLVAAEEEVLWGNTASGLVLVALIDMVLRILFFIMFVFIYIILCLYNLNRKNVLTLRFLL